MKNKRVIRNLLFGLGMGLLISILPLPLNFLLIVILCLFSGTFLLRSPSRWQQRLLELGIAAATVTIAILLPVKPLDRRVGPMRYAAMPFNQLRVALGQDWNVIILPDFSTNEASLIAFSTSEPMSRRQVLEKLARETGGELHIGYCGTGATFLFGVYPSFTTLRLPPPKEAPSASQP